MWNRICEMATDSLIFLGVVAAGLTTLIFILAPALVMLACAYFIFMSVK